MEPVNTTNMEYAASNSSAPKPPAKNNPHFPFMGIGSLVYALLYTFFLYKNTSGITYPFFVGGTCLFFFLYLKKSGIAAKSFSIFIVSSLMLLGLSTCLTSSATLHIFNTLGIFLLFFYLFLHNLYEDNRWDLTDYIGSIINIIFTSLTFIYRPFSDLFNYLEDKRKTSDKSNSKGKYVILGLVIAMPLLFIILLLLCSADAVFSNIFGSLFGDLLDFIFEGNAFGIVFLFLFSFFASYCIMCRLSVHNLKEEVTEKRTAEPLVGITITAVISLVYLVFCFIQIVYLFGGLGSLPKNYTYAEYAREGFFQLVFVCLINLSMVLICIKRFRKNNILKGLLVFISICTYIMIASSAYRMLLYIDAYLLTFLRVLVLWGLFVIFLMLSGAMVILFKEDFPYFRYCVVTITLLYLLFSFAKPDYWIARYNLNRALPVSEIERLTEAGEFFPENVFTDYGYLNDLSLDAAPVILAKVDSLGYGEKRWFIRYTDKIPEKIPTRKWNLSRWIAMKQYQDFLK